MTTAPITFSQILSAIGTDARSAGFAFERAVRGLLEAMADAPQCVIPHGIGSMDLGWDFTVNCPLRGLQAPVYVCAKFHSRFSARTVREFLATKLPEKCGTRLLVVSGRPTPGASDFMHSSREAQNESFVVWDYDFLTQTLAEDPSLGRKMLERLNSTPAEIVRNLAGDATRDWRNARSEHLKRLNDAWLDDHLTIFLGAGISTGAGLKTWAALLNAISAEAIGTSTQLREPTLGHVVDRFVATSQSSPLILARYLRTSLTETVLVEEVRKALYADVGRDGIGTSPAYERLAQICAPRRSGFGVRAIVNYNYDDLMIKHLKSRGISCCLVTDQAQVPTSDELPIFHVHGFLPQDPRQETGTGIPSSLILSEEKYHSLYQDPYNWPNWIQLSFLSSSTCLILGHSLTDPNLRRLLEISHSKLTPGRSAAKHSGTVSQANHYAILPRMNARKFLAPRCRESNCPSVKRDAETISIEEADRFLARHHETEERLYEELGINVIWVETWDEIPEILEQVGRSRQT